MHLKTFVTMYILTVSSGVLTLNLSSVVPIICLHVK